MNKNLIKKHLQSLTSLNEDKVPQGLTATKKVQDDEKKVNSDGLKDMEKELSDYDKALKQNDENAIEPNKVNYATDNQKEYHDQMEILNGMEMLRYTNEPNKQFKERALEGIEGSSKMGNNSEWANVVPKQQGFTGPEFGKKLVDRIKASAKKREDATPPLVQFGDDIELEPKKTKKMVDYTKTAIEENKINNITENNKNTTNKMKRLVFKKEFSDLGNALKLIPESYKVNDKTFEMTDGNMNVKIRWEGSLNEGKAIVLQASDKKLVNEDIQKMKHLFGYKSQETLGLVKGKERINEDTTFNEIWNKTKKLMTESTDIESVKAPVKNTDEKLTQATDAKKEINGSVKKEKALPNTPTVKTDNLGDAGINQAPEAKEEIEGSVSQTSDFPEKVKVKTAEFDKTGIKQAPEAKKHIHLKENEETDVEVKDDWEAKDEEADIETEKEPSTVDIKSNLPIDVDAGEEDEIKVPSLAFNDAKSHRSKSSGNYIIVATKEGGQKEYIDVPSQYIELAKKNPKMALNKIVATKELEAENVPSDNLDEGLGDIVDKLKSGFKQVMGQEKQWKLDGSYTQKASKDAQDYLMKHPASKEMGKALLSKGLDQNQAKEAILHIIDWGGKPDWNSVTFDKATGVLSMEPPKGVSNPNPTG